jgi:hypothetical protein
MPHPNRILAVIFPSVILLTAAWWTALPDTRIYREVFGNDNYYLDLYYEVNPDGWLRRAAADRPVRFRGRLTTNTGDYPVTGVRQATAQGVRYEFDSSAGKFSGRLSPSDKGCEPSLRFRLQGLREPSAQGTLRAGFCSGS